MFGILYQNKFLILLISVSFAFSNMPSTLIGQRNKTKINQHQKFIKIEKSHIYYVYEIDGDKVVSVNFDRKNRLTSKTNYKIEQNQNIFLIQDNCLEKDCYQFIDQ